MFSGSFLKRNIDSFKPVIRWAKVYFTPLAVLFLAYFGWQSKDVLAGIAADADIQWLAGSVLLWVVLHFISPIFTVVVFRSNKLSIRYDNAFFVHAGRLPAKYLPGGIWHTVARAADYHQHGFTGRHVASYLFVENIVAAAVTLTAGGLIVSTLPHISSAWVTLAATVSIFAAGVLLSLPLLVNKYLLPASEALAPAAYGKGVICSFFYWTVAGASFICFLKSFPELIMTVSEIEAGGVYIFSWGVGFITIFSPQGIGISEFVSGKLLGTTIGVGGTAAFLVGFRAAILLADISAWLLSKFLRARVS